MVKAEIILRKKLVKTDNTFLSNSLENNSLSGSITEQHDHFPGFCPSGKCNSNIRSPFSSVFGLIQLLSGICGTSLDTLQLIEYVHIKIIPLHEHIRD